MRNENLIAMPIFLAVCGCGSEAVDTTITGAPTAETTRIEGPEGLATDHQVNVTQPTTPVVASSCSGFYAHLDPRGPDGNNFTIEIQPTAVSVVWSDYSRYFAEKETNADGSLRFHLDNGGPSTLVCRGDQATVEFAETQWESMKTFQLARTDRDIFAIARARGWPLEE